MKFFRPYCFLLVVSLVIMTLGSCSKNQAIFDVDTYLEATLIAGTSPQTVWVFEKQVIFPYSLQLQAFSKEESDIMSINSSYGLAYPKNNSGLDLSFINEMTIDVLNPDNLDEAGKEVFYYDQQNFNRITEIELFPSLPDIKDYVRDDRIILKIEWIFNTPPPQTFDMAFELEFGAIPIEP